MQRIEKIVSNYNDAEFFILDSHGANYEQVDKDYKIYKYNINWNNQLKKHDIFLYRKPQRATKDHKFVIYGGGVISSISKPDDKGNVIAEICDGFILTWPIKQGDSIIENLQWEKKKKINNGWKNFWNQYGINKIEKQDFLNLMSGQSYVLDAGTNVDDSEDIPLIEDIPSSKFELTVINSKNSKNSTHVSTKNSIKKNIDFTKIQKRQKTIGDLGEQIVFDLLKKDADEKGIKEPEHVSSTIGDGLGYDIKAFNKDDKELLIEVKSTTRKSIDGFYMSKNECNIAKKHPDSYQIYRVFDIDVEQATAKVCILDGPFNDQEYKFVAETVKVYLKG